MDMPEDCWSDHVGLLQEVPNASSADHQQQPQSSSSDYLMLSHSHHHESIDPSKFLCASSYTDAHTCGRSRGRPRHPLRCATTSFCRHDRSSSGALERRLIRLTLRVHGHINFHVLVHCALLVQHRRVSGVHRAFCKEREREKKSRFKTRPNSRHNLKINVFCLSCYTPGWMQPAGVSQMCRNLRHSQNIPSSQNSAIRHLTKSNSSPLVHTSSLTSLLTPSNKHPTNSGYTHHLKILTPFHSTSSLCAAAAGRAPPPPARIHPSRVYTDMPLSVSLPRA
ncbi:unnamed protein product [Trichogramma brassicae]|uniref:Uncharacterized protein n=1 Tax=Trichogramma brassicae TaxID=86971 RepID=A0A6H5IYT7_9HYME|nr:unnamed protein product [Trichogramma brassicae]